MADHIFPVLLIKDLINEDGEPTTPFKLATGTKTSISHLPVLFFSCVVKKSTAHVGENTLNMHHPSAKGFSRYPRWYYTESKMVFFYVPHRRKIISSYNVVFCESFSSALAYTSQPYVESMDIVLDVSYIPYSTSSREKTGDIITFTQFEERDLLSEIFTVRKSVMNLMAIQRLHH